MYYILVGVGGAFGAVMRALLMQAFPISIFKMPLQVVMVNVLGSFLAGLCVVVLPVFFSNYRLNDLILVGFLGGFTTFSAFSIDLGRLYEKQLYVQALIYIMVSICFSLIAFWGGTRLVHFCLGDEV